MTGDLTIANAISANATASFPVGTEILSKGYESFDQDLGEGALPVGWILEKEAPVKK